MSAAFENRVAVVVGGGRGIGRATVLELARRGAHVAIVDSGCAIDGTAQDPTVAQSVADEVRARGGHALALAMDASEADAARHVVDATRQQFGRVDLGFYTAGLGIEATLSRLEERDLDGVFRVHVWGALRFTRELGAALVAQRTGGAILLTLSGSAFFGASRQAPLAMASGAVAGLTKTAAAELGRHRIRVNAIAPIARTRLTEHLPLFQSIRPDSLSVEHVAQVACHLLSDDGADLQGELIGVAGGRVYAFQTGETSGLFQEGPPMEAEALAARFREVTRT